jgi:type IV pilus assembly protein PilB
VLHQAQHAVVRAKRVPLYAAVSTSVFMSAPRLIATASQLAALLELRSKPAPRIGELLVAQGDVALDAVQAAVVSKTAGNRARLGDILVAMGVVTRDTIEGTLAAYTATPVLDLRKYPLNPEALAALTATASNLYRCLPVEQLGKTLVVAFQETPRPDQLQALRFASGSAVVAVLASQAPLLESLMARHFPNTDSTILVHPKFNKEKYLQLSSAAETSAGFFRYLTALAIANKASDVHLRPHQDGTRQVLLRVDGSFRQVKVVSEKDVQGLVRHIEVLSNIDSFSKNRPKEGRLTFEHDGRNVDLRVSVITSVNGDSVVLRVLDPQRLPDSLEQLALPTAAQTALAEVLVRPHGLLLATGPTGSGKTTTLYTLLKELQARKLHVVTAEDPVEARLPGVNQFQTNDFGALLPQLLRHDPDVIMVGELRDERTVMMAVNAALTGHLVLSTVHANDSASTLHRLLGLGAPLHMLSSSLSGILSQRLVRLTCLACTGIGCGACDGSGYRGRTLAVELARPRASLSSLSGSPSHTELESHLNFIGDVTLDSAIANLAETGKTTWTEATGLMSNPAYRNTLAEPRPGL